MIRIRFSKIEPWAFLVFAAICTLLSARSFFDARQTALGFAEAARQMLPPDDPAHLIAPVNWSAPLDDVFIHFDFARSLARGQFFEWARGGGYSSGATSWLYPAILALPYAAGVRGFALGHFSDWFSCMCVFAGLCALRSAYQGLSRWAPYLIASALMSLGVFGWALWSGMELPLFFALWCSGQAVFRNLEQPGTTRAPLASAWLLGFIGLLLTATRPESLICIGIWFAFAWRENRSAYAGKVTRALLLPLFGPSLLLLCVRAVFNWVYTGELADAGSIVKLEPLAPFYDTIEVLRLWAGNMGFQFGRITAYHAGDNAVSGSLLWLLVIGALWQKSTRRDARMLCMTALLWIMVVANNEYVRYQNDRYTMAPLAWLVIAASLFVVKLGQRTFDKQLQSRPIIMRLAPFALALGVVVTWSLHQLPRLRQQNWLFGRACKNIAEQQVRLGLLLSSTSESANHQILVGDAGAIQYFSDLPGVDAIGLGATRGLPFARAVRLGIGATVELIERMPPQQRPDLMALYPSWWKDLPLWFGRPIFELDIAGNVICGAPNKVVYSAEWRGLDSESPPFAVEPGWHIVDALDVADLVSEASHDYKLFERHSGYVLMKILPHPREPSRDVFDAGRILFRGNRARFHFSNFQAGQRARLVIRAAPAEPMSCRVSLDNKEMGKFTQLPQDAWQETSLEIDGNLIKRAANFEIISDQGECNLFHIWVLQPDS